MAALTDDDRAALRETLATFTREDPSRFVAGRLVEPRDTCFPEPFSRTEEGLRTLAQRLLAHAGLGQLRAEVALPPDAVDESKMLPETHTAFAGVEGDVVHISCSRLGRADDAALSLVHEVARAALLLRRERATEGPYRASPTTLRTPPETNDEHRAASILAVHLGLGILVAKGAHTYRATGRSAGSTAITAWQHVVYGGLAPEAASYLLAVQLVVRALGPERIDTVLAALSEERQAEVRAEMARLDRRPLTMPLLGTAPEAEWPTEEAGPLPPLPVWEPTFAIRPELVESFGQRPVFRVRRDRRAVGVFVGAVSTLVLVLVVKLTILADLDSSLSVLFALVPVAGAAVGGALGSRRAYDDCSNCEHRLAETSARCDYCRRHVAGRIAHRNDRLEAEERWLRDRAG